MVIYEVNLQIDTKISNDFGSWLHEHLKEMLEMKGFLSADWYQVEPEPGAEPSTVAWTVQYRVNTRAHLNEYFEKSADRMRAEGLKRFGSRFSASRRILIPRT